MTVDGELQHRRLGGSAAKRRAYRLLASALLAATLPGCAPEPPPRNLLFISLDTTRQDHFSFYGCPRETTPAFDELARRSAVFENAVAQMTITNPSHASMFTGLYPKTHGVGENARKLSDRCLTMTEILSAAGFRTGGFVSGHPLKTQVTGIDQGFEVYDSQLKQRRDGGQTTARALEWLKTVDSGDRFFLFVHLYDAHGPYRRKPEYEGLFESAEPGRRLGYIPRYQRVRGEDQKFVERANEFVDRYDRLLRYQDDLVQELLDSVDLDDTVVAIVADHGETLIEREERFNLSHGNMVFDEQILIPFLLYSPRLEPGRYRHTAETVDLLPTLLDLLDLQPPPGVRFEGQSLAPIVAGGAASAAANVAFASNRVRPAAAEYRDMTLERGEFIHTVRTRRWKLIVYPGLERDPAEQVDVSAEHPEQLESLLEAFNAWRTAEPPTEPDSDLAPEDLEDLRALGYVG